MKGELYRKKKTTYQCVAQHLHGSLQYAFQALDALKK